MEQRFAKYAWCCAGAMGIAVSACGGSPAPASTARPAPDGEPDPPGSTPAPVPADGVTLLPLKCLEEDRDACNAVDDDCDGRLDEGCGVAQEEVVLAMAWNTGAQIRVDVASDHETLPVTPSPGCGSGTEENLHVAHASWAEVTSGQYRVSVQYADGCGDQGVTTASLSLAVRGRVFGPYNRHFRMGEQASVLSFAVP